MGNLDLAVKADRIRHCNTAPWILVLVLVVAGVLVYSLSSFTNQELYEVVEQNL
jgi:hypothetical protein